MQSGSSTRLKTRGTCSPISEHQRYSRSLDPSQDLTLKIATASYLSAIMTAHHRRILFAYRNCILVSGQSKVRRGWRSRGGWIASGALLVAIGALVYLAWRPKTLLACHWIYALGAASQLNALREALAGLQPHLPAFIIFSLPHALWSAGFCCCLRGVAAGEEALGSNCRWWVIPLALSVGGEVGQLLGVPGTFDLIDLAFTMSAIALVVAVSKFPIRQGFNLRLQENIREENSYR